MSVKRNLVSRLTRTRLLVPLLLIVLLLPAVYFYATRPKETAAWWNESWIYRKRIDISNPGGTDLTDFQISFTLDTTDTSKFQSNCEDLRITGVDGNLLPFWIEENNPGCGDANTKVWVKLPSIPSSGTYIYAYYGNPSASQSSEHDGNKVFEFFDDFSSTSLDTNKWEDWTTDSNTTSYTISNGEIQLTGQCNTGIKTKTYSGENYRVIARTKDNTDSGLILRVTDNDHLYLIRTNASGNATDYYMRNGSWTSLGGGYANFGTWTEWRIVEFSANGTSLSSKVDGTQLNTVTNATYSSGKIGLRRCSGSPYFDWVFVQKFASTDPSSSTQSEEIGTGPIGYWKFDEGTGTTAYDSSSHNNHGTINTATWINEGECISEKCLSFDGSSRVDTTLNTNNLPIPVTFTAWFYLTQSTTEQPIISGYVSHDNRWDIIYNRGGNNKVGWLYHSGGTVYSTNTISLNEWHQIVVIHTGTSVELYLDGIYQNTLSTTKGVNTGQTIRIGAWYNNTLSFKGLIDEVKIYPYARTNDQIENEYKLNSAAVIGSGTLATPSARPDDSIIAHWSLDEQTGQTAYDKINDYSLTLGADTNPNTDDPTWKPSTDCKINGCLEFASGKYARRYLDVPQDHSISFWTKPSVISGTQNLFSFQNLHYVVRLLSTGKIGFQTHDGASYQYCNGNTSIDTTNYHHILVTYDSTTETKKIYIDGELDVSCTQGNYVAGLTNRIFTIGGVNTDFNFSGIIDEFKIYNSALTSGQIKQDMNAGSTLAVGTTTSEAADLDDGEGNPPIAEWKFDEKTGSTANDTSGNNYTATLSGATWESSLSCKEGACLKFEGGSNSYADLSSDSITDTTYTIEAWYQLHNNTSRQTIFSFNNGSGNGYQFLSVERWMDGSGSFTIFIGDGTSYSNYGVTSNLTEAYNSWSHVAITRNGNDFILYVNGQQRGTFSDTKSATMSRVLFGSRNGNRLYGMLDTMRIYDYVRSPAQIAYDYNRGEPVAHWKMDECQGSTIHDSSDNGNHGTWNGSGGTQTSVGTCTTSGTAWGNGSTGKFGASLNFDGEDDYLVKTSPNNRPTKSEATWSWWSKIITIGFVIIPRWTSSPTVISWRSCASKIVVNCTICTFGMHRSG